MALGRRKREQQEIVCCYHGSAAVAGDTSSTTSSTKCLTKRGSTRLSKKLCEPYYAERLGRPGIPPGVYFRMMFVGYFEGIDSQRGIAWALQ